MKTCLLLPALALMSAGGSLAAEPEGAQPLPVKEKKVCHTEKVTGSLTRVNRICLTQRQWDELASRTKRGLDEFASGAKHPNSPNPNSGM